MNSSKRFIFSLIILFTTSCAGSYKHSLDFNPAEPIRVAVLPFYQMENGNVVADELDGQILVDNVPLISSKLKASPANLVQGVVQEQFAQTGLELVPPGFVLAQLGHRGFVRAGKVAVNSILNAEPKELGDLLQADAIMYGSLTDWSRSYYGLQTVNTVGLKLKLVRTSDGKVLFASEGKDSVSRGLTGIPTGFAPIVLEPLAGLDSENIRKLSETLIKKMLSPLVVKNRPEFLNSSAPAIYAAVHDGEAQVINSKRPLSVLLLGTPEKEAYFSVGKTASNIPMFEQEAGHYVGKFLPLASSASPDSKNSDNEKVVVILKDKFGRVSEREISAKVKVEY